jgi:FKBP-type peptidyl-prolyl cis-trans isomerase
VAFDDAYADKIGEFDAENVRELKVEALRQGDGAAVKETDTILINYTGWTADGKIFDTSRKTADSEATAISLSLEEVMPGWTEGLAGQKVGGVYLLSIPSEKAYYDEVMQSHPLYRLPLKFIVEIKEIQ